jgi:hypothetical protein
MVQEAVNKLRLRSTILDGEIVALDAEGIPRFQLLQRWQKRPAAPVCFYLFDLLWSDGPDFTGRTIVQRRERLEQIITPMDGLQVGGYIETRAHRSLERCVANFDIRGCLNRRDYKFKGRLCFPAKLQDGSAQGQGDPQRNAQGFRPPRRWSARPHPLIRERWAIFPRAQAVFSHPDGIAGWQQTKCRSSWKATLPRDG